VDSFEIIKKTLRKRTNIKKKGSETMVKNVKYVLIGENDEPIKNEDSNLDMKTAEIILENIDEITEFNARNL